MSSPVRKRKVDSTSRQNSCSDILPHILRLFQTTPHLRNPHKYEILCTFCSKVSSLVENNKYGVAICSHCGSDNVVLPSMANYRWLRFDCSSRHVAMVHQSEEPEDCPSCLELLVDSKCAFKVETQVQKPRLRRNLEDEKRREIMRELKRKPYKVFPELFECRCVWEGCQKMFTPYDIEGEKARCSHCSKEVPIEFGEPGSIWVFYNRCSHIQAVRQGQVPRNCPICGLESAVRQSGISAPRRKVNTLIELPNDLN